MNYFLTSSFGRLCHDLLPAIVLGAAISLAATNPGPVRPAANPPFVTDTVQFTPDAPVHTFFFKLRALLVVAPGRTSLADIETERQFALSTAY